MDFGTYAEWAVSDLVPFGMYVIGFCILLVLIGVLFYTVLYIGWICHIFLTIKANLLADKLEEKADRDFEKFLDEQDKTDNG